MSPAGGSGANTALRDAALLASELGAAARGEKSQVQAIGDYERRMIDYGFAAVRASRRFGDQASGLRQRRSGKRAKSVSFDNMSAAYSSANAVN